MAKALLEYNLDDTEDSMAFNRAVISTKMVIAIWEITHNLRSEIEDKLESNKKAKPLDLVFERIHEILQDNDINIDELFN